MYYQSDHDAWLERPYTNPPKWRVEEDFDPDTTTGDDGDGERERLESTARINLDPPKSTS